MSAPEVGKDSIGASHVEKRGSATTQIREVQNVALADATAKSGVSPWTPAMFRVRIAYPGYFEEYELTNYSFTSACWLRL